jgi:hypothetical protein
MSAARSSAVLGTRSISPVATALEAMASSHLRQGDPLSRRRSSWWATNVLQRGVNRAEVVLVSDECGREGRAREGRLVNRGGDRSPVVAVLVGVSDSFLRVDADSVAVHIFVEEY